MQVRKKYEKQLQSVSKREGKFGAGCCGCGKRITRKDREDTKQAKERDTEELEERQQATYNEEQ